MTALTHIVATLALLFGLFCSRADAYVLKTCGDKPVVWPITEIDIVVDLSSAPASLIDQLPGGSIAAKDDDDKDGKSSSDDKDDDSSADDKLASKITVAARRSFQTWSDAGIPIAFNITFVNSPVKAGLPNDGVSVVRWETDQWGYPDQQAAVTLSSCKLNSGTRSSGTDIVLNGVNKRWTTDPASHPDALDIQSVLTHEIGHLVGLGHSEDTTATMHVHTIPGDASKRSLELDDRQGLDALYDETLRRREEAEANGGGGLDDDPTAGGCNVGEARLHSTWSLWLLLLGLFRLIYRGNRRAATLELPANPPR